MEWENNKRVNVTCVNSFYRMGVMGFEIFYLDKINSIS